MRGLVLVISFSDMSCLH